MSHPDCSRLSEEPQRTHPMGLTSEIEELTFAPTVHWADYGLTPVQETAAPRPAARDLIAAAEAPVPAAAG